MGKIKTKRLIRTAVIDVGTLKTKFEVREYNRNLQSKVIHREKQLTVLGRDLNKTDNRIIDSAVAKTIMALNDFRGRMLKLRVDKFKVVGTEAIRKARNAVAVLNKIEAETGMAIEILGHQDEAEIYFHCVSKDFPGKTIAVSDIGGGSVQVVIGRDDEIFETHLFKTGTYYMQEVFSRTRHPTPNELQNAVNYIRQQLIPLAKCRHRPEFLVYGSTNIIDFMQAMKAPLTVRSKNGEHCYEVKVHQLQPVYETITALSYEDRMPLYPAEPYYMWAADKALMNIFQICEYLKVARIVPSNNNISSGLLYELAKEVWQKRNQRE